MAKSLSFNAPKTRKAKTLTFSLNGRDMKFKVPKQYGLIMAAGADNNAKTATALFEWLDQGLSEADQKHIEERLLDPNDSLDVEYVSEIIQALIEEASGNPTT